MRVLTLEFTATDQTKQHLSFFEDELEAVKSLLSVFSSHRLPQPESYAISTPKGTLLISERR
jgi:hypothetical protein